MSERAEHHGVEDHGAPAPSQSLAPAPVPVPASGVAPGGQGLVLGFARGVSPSKWARRWAEADPDATELRLVPLELDGRAPAGTPIDVTLERVAPGERPAGSVADAHGQAARHAVRLYTESIALVVAVDHPLADEASVDRDALDLVPLLDHPDHAAAWPEPQPWNDDAWAPVNAAAALELVATGAGAILLPLPLARHLARKRTHTVVPITGEAAPPGTEIWATWAAERDDEDVQRLVGILRGRTARSGRGRSNDAQSATTAGSSTAKTANGEKSATAGPRTNRTTSSRTGGPPKNSRGAQLAAARAKRRHKG